MADHLPPPPVIELVDRCVSELGLDLDAVELRGTGPKRLLRVVIDRDGGVPLDVITETSRELSRELDRSDVMGVVGYTLEVTSRGVDRPLTLTRHWTRNVGRLVVITTVEGDAVRIENVMTGRGETLTGVGAVVVVGNKLSAPTPDGLPAAVEVHRIGDCVVPRHTAIAIYEGEIAGRAV